MIVTNYGRRIHSGCAALQSVTPSPLFFPCPLLTATQHNQLFLIFPPHTHSLLQSFLHQHPLHPNMQPTSSPRGSHRAYTWYPHHIHTFIRKGWRRSKHIRDRDGALFDRPIYKKVAFLPNYTLNCCKMILWLLRKHPFMIWWVIRAPRCQQLCFYSDTDKHTNCSIKPWHEKQLCCCFTVVYAAENTGYKEHRTAAIKGSPYITH